jgi:hypothetical protein
MLYKSPRIFFARNHAPMSRGIANDMVANVRRTLPRTKAPCVNCARFAAFGSALGFALAALFLVLA